jgi:hypothetical protein
MRHATTAWAIASRVRRNRSGNLKFGHYPVFPRMSDWCCWREVNPIECASRLRGITAGSVGQIAKTLIPLTVSTRR